MPHRDDVAIDVGDLSLRDSADGRTLLADLPGVHIVVLLRHRH